jgi:MFS family permease
VLQGINGIASAHMKDVGLDAGYIATVLSAHSLALAGFKFLTGILYDKFGGRKTMLLCSVTATVVTALQIRFILSANQLSPPTGIMRLSYNI